MLIVYGIAIALVGFLIHCARMPTPLERDIKERLRRKPKGSYGS